jgi:CubicO group peptidase (beta-lactamase class C family)
MLHHEGGAPAQPPDELWKQLWADGDQPDARAKFVAAILARPPAQKPGTFVYSNTSYMIADAMLEKRTGKRWEQLMCDELFAKLGMTTCGVGAPGRKDVTDAPWGHDAGDTPIAPGPAADNPPGLGPAGTVHCSLEDYGKFLALHSTGKPALLEPATLEHLHAAPNMGYAGGFMVVSSPRGTLLVHSGSNTLWYVTAMVSLAQKPEERFAFVMATNSGNGAIERVFERLVKRHVGAK